MFKVKVIFGFFCFFPKFLLQFKNGRGAGDSTSWVFRHTGELGWLNMITWGSTDQLDLLILLVNPFYFCITKLSNFIFAIDIIFIFHFFSLDKKDLTFDPLIQLSFYGHRPSGKWPSANLWAQRRSTEKGHCAPAGSKIGEIISVCYSAHRYQSLCWPLGREGSLTQCFLFDL